MVTATPTGVEFSIDRADREHRRNIEFGETGDPKSMATSGSQYLRPDTLAMLEMIHGGPVTRIKVTFTPIG